ncbi:MAG: hypothetical protein WB510_16945, partial [Candidatus Sulfotelmatobacter sp.]
MSRPVAMRLETSEDSACGAQGAKAWLRFLGRLTQAWKACSTVRCRWGGVGEVGGAAEISRRVS